MSLKQYTQIHWGKVLLALLPPLLRNKNQVVWLQVLLKPLTDLYKDNLYKMQHNGQVMYLEKVLNDAFNENVAYQYNASITQKMAEGYIVIEDAHRPSVQYLYTNREINESRGESIYVTKNSETLNLQLESRNFLYLSGASDFNSTEFFNFRILIPDHLLVSYEQYKNALSCIQEKYKAGSITQEQQQKEIQKLGDILVTTQDQKISSHPNSVKIITPKFHKVINYYKLAGKSYETRLHSISS